MNLLVFDIEGNGLREIFIPSGKKNRDQWRPEITEVHCICVRDAITNQVWRYVSNPWVVEQSDGDLWQGYVHLMMADLLIAHNGIDYDMPVLRRLVFPKDHVLADEPPLLDTIVMSRFLYPDAKHHPNARWMSGSGPNALDAWGRRLKCFKGDFDGPWDRLTQKMLDYCVQDTLVDLKIYRFLLPLMMRWKQHSKIEHEFARIMSAQSCNGVSYNHTEADKFFDRLTLELAVLSDKLTKIFPAVEIPMKTPQYWEAEVNGTAIQAETKGELKEIIKWLGVPITKTLKEATPGPVRVQVIPFNPGSDIQVADRLKERYDWKPTIFTDGGRAKVSEDVLAAMDYSEAAVINEWRMVDMRIGMVYGWSKRADNSRDGRIHGGVNPNGTPTTRCTHSQPNITQVTKVIFGDADSKGIIAPIHGYAGRYGFECRNLFGPREGWVQIGGDASGLELRMLANITFPFDNGAYAKILLEGDIHTHNLNQIPILSTRPQSKEVFYAGNYGCGDEKAGKVIMFHKSLNQQQRARYAGMSPTQVGKDFKIQLNKGCPALGKAIERCKLMSRTKGYVILLDGRHAPCRSEHSALNTKCQGDGGVLCKLACCLAVAELTKLFGPPSIGIGFPGRWALMINAHDEMQAESEPEIADKVGQIIAGSYKRAGKKLRCKIETPGEYKIGSSWAECH